MWPRLWIVKEAIPRQDERKWEVRQLYCLPPSWKKMIQCGEIKWSPVCSHLPEHVATSAEGNTIKLLFYERRFVYSIMLPSAIRCTYLWLYIRATSHSCGWNVQCSFSQDTTNPHRLWHLTSAPLHASTIS